MPAKLADAAAGTSRAEQPRPTVLLVEDEPTIRVTLGDDLEDAGFAVTRADNGLDALALLAAHRFGAVITDLRLPGADGLAVVRAVRRSQPSARVLVISAYFDAPFASALREGATAAMTKPFCNTRVVEWTLGAAAEPPAPES